MAEAALAHALDLTASSVPCVYRPLQQSLAHQLAHLQLLLALLQGTELLQLALRVALKLTLKPLAPLLASAGSI